MVRSATPIPQHRYSPHLLVTPIPASAHYLLQTEYKKLRDKVSAFFVRYHRVHPPYRVTFKLPLLTPLAKRTLRDAFESLFLQADHWPLFLQRYLWDGLMLVNAKLKTLGDRLLTKNLDSVPSSSLYLEPVSPCPCSAWLADDFVSELHGHASFRDPEVLRDLCPDVDISVFTENFNNTTIPSWSQFET